VNREARAPRSLRSLNSFRLPWRRARSAPNTCRGSAAGSGRALCRPIPSGTQRVGCTMQAGATGRSSSAGVRPGTGSRWDRWRGSRPRRTGVASSTSSRGSGSDGSRGLRGVAIEQAWAWLRFQPERTLSRWYQSRFGADAAASEDRDRGVGEEAADRAVAFRRVRGVAGRRHRVDADTAGVARESRSSGRRYGRGFVWVRSPAFAAWCPRGPPVRWGLPSTLQPRHARAQGLMCSMRRASARIEGRAGRRRLHC